MHIHHIYVLHYVCSGQESIHPTIDRWICTVNRNRRRRLSNERHTHAARSACGRGGRDMSASARELAPPLHQPTNHPYAVSAPAAASTAPCRAGRWRGSSLVVRRPYVRTNARRGGRWPAGRPASASSYSTYVRVAGSGCPRIGDVELADGGGL